MILAIDMGNSNIVVGGIDKDASYFTERITTIHAKTDLEYAVTLRDILEIHKISLSRIEGCILSSVVPPLTDTMLRAVEKIAGIKPMVVGSGMKTGLNIRMDNPKTVGSDLIVNAVAALAAYPLPCVILDMGTATTLSVLDENGSYIGGVICPGLKLSLDSLSSHTAQLPKIGLHTPNKTIGKNTVDCMKSGIFHGNAAMIDGLTHRIDNELGKPAAVVATGGLAQEIIPLCRRKIVYDHTLSMKGLYILFEKNK